METPSDDLQTIESTYTVISYPASKLPDSYKNMIFSKWLRSLKYGNTYFKLIDNESYFAAYHKYVEMVIAKPETVVRLAVLSDDHDVVLGFSVARDNVLDYIHVQRDYRRESIGTSLIPAQMLVNKGEGYVITHLTTIGVSIWNSKLSKAIFNPFA